MKDNAPAAAAELTTRQLQIIYLKLGLVSAIWGGTFVAGRALAGTPPLVSASLRFVLASVALFFCVWGMRKNAVMPTGKQMLHLAMLGFFGIFSYNVFFFYGLTYTTASRASLVVALNPAMIALASFFLFRERLRGLQIIGIALCIAGAFMVILSRNEAALEGSLSGDVVILGCVFSWVVYSVFSRSLSQTIGPLLTVSWSIWLGTIMLCAATLTIEGGSAISALGAVSPAQWGSLAFLGFVGSAVAYIWYYDGIRQIGATRAGAFIALNPATAVLFGVLLFGETLTPFVCLGGALAVCGIYFCNSAKE